MAHERAFCLADIWETAPFIYWFYSRFCFEWQFEWKKLNGWTSSLYTIHSYKGRLQFSVSSSHRFHIFDAFNMRQSGFCFRLKQLTRLFFEKSQKNLPSTPIRLLFLLQHRRNLTSMLFSRLNKTNIQRTCSAINCQSIYWKYLCTSELGKVIKFKMRILCIPFSVNGGGLGYDD